MLHLVSISNPLLLCLHGWGGSKESFTELRAALNGAPIEILSPDLPGFGTEKEPLRAWNVDDYAAWVEQYVLAHARMHGRKLLLLGHSHGGRIAMKLAVRGNLSIHRLYLCAPAGIRRGQYVKRAMGFLIAKTGKLLLRLPLMLNRIEPLSRRLLYRLLRTHDYERASTVMRETMARITAENFRPLLPQIQIPTDIFWGKEDRITPFGDARIAEREIPQSTLHTFHGVRHAVHRDRAKEIAAVIVKNAGTQTHT